MEKNPVAFYGFTAVPSDPDVLFKDHPTASGPDPKQDRFTVADFPLPDSHLVKQVREFVKAELNEQTYNHCLRVYVYGTFRAAAIRSGQYRLVGTRRHRASADSFPELGV